MNIEETTKQPTIVDPSLRDAPKLDLSSIRANVDAIQAEALRLNDIIQAMPKQDSTTKGSITSPTPMDSTGKMQIPQLQQKTEEQRMAEFKNQRQMSFQAMGITEEDFNKRQNLATQMSSLNAQLQQLDVAEQQAMLDIENLMPGALLSRVRGEQAQVQRTLSFKKAGIAAQMSALSGEYSAIQGRIDEAQNFFNQYIEYATFEKKQEMDDYKWALDFYQDIDESEKKWLQQEYENKRSEYEFDVNQKNEEARIKLLEAQYELDVAQTFSGLGSVGSIGGGMVAPEQEKIVLKNYVDQLPVGQRDAAYGAIATFKNGQDIISLLDSVDTGPLAGRGQSIQQMFGSSSEEFNRLKAAMTSFAANYIKGISGVAVSEQEFKRLMSALPNVNKQGNVNKDVIKELLNTIKNKYSTQLGINFDAFPNEIPSPTTDIQFEREYNQLYGTSKKEGGFLQSLGSFFFGGSK